MKTSENGRATVKAQYLQTQQRNEDDKLIRQRQVETHAKVR